MTTTINNHYVVIEPYGGLPCAAEVFTIDGKDAWDGDFGHSEDMDRMAAPDYGCGCREFIPDTAPADGVLEKYQIDVDTFNDICELLSEELRVGRCAWCS